MTPRPKSQGWVQTRVTSRWKLRAPPGQLSTEINTEAPEPEAEPDQTPAEPEAAEPTPENPSTVVIGGRAIPLDEIERGFLRQADYTRKTQEVAVERQTLTAERTTLTSERSQAKAALDLATDLLKAHLPPEPDPALIDTDVIGFMQQERAYKAAMLKLQSLADERQKLDAGTAKEREEATAAARNADSEALATELQQARAKMPEFATPESVKAFFTKAEAYAAHHGVKPEEVNGLRDHRMLLILSDAMKWRDLQDKKPAAVERAKAAPPIRTAPRQASGTRSADQVRAARERLSREGSIEAAADILDDSLFE
jgi:hypothetical protein